MIRIPAPRDRHLYVSAGRMLRPEATGGPRYTVTRGSGVTLRLLRVRGTFAILTQSFRKAGAR